MLPDRVLNPGPLTYESGALPIALRGPATFYKESITEFVERDGETCKMQGFASTSYFVALPIYSFNDL